MPITDQIRERRQARIRKLREGQAAELQHAGRQETVQRPEAGLTNYGGMKPNEAGYPDRIYEDPEIAWKYRDNPWELGGRSTPSRPAAPEKDWKRPPVQNEFISKMTLSVLLFALVYMMFQLHQPWAERGQKLVTEALSQDSDFSAVSAWYTKIFGDSPSFIPIFEHKSSTAAKKVTGSISHPIYTPVKGSVQPGVGAFKTGVQITTSADAEVLAFSDGVVLSVEKNADGSENVTIQHSEGYQTTYGELENCQLAVNDWVKGGDTIGTVHASSGGGRLDFALQQNGVYKNPADVVSFD